MSSLPQPRGPVSEALFAGLRSRRTRARPAGRRRSIPRISSSRCTAATSCTTAGSRASTTRGSGSRRCSRSARELERRFEAELLELVGPPGRAAGPARDRRAAARADAGRRRAVGLDLHRARGDAPSRCSSSWSTARPTSSRRPTRTRGRCRGCRASRRRRWSRCRPTSTATGAPEDIHAELFARAMDAVGLDSTYGAYLDQIPGVTLATVNLMSLFGLHRRLRGAIVGHLALFEMTSSVPNRRYASGPAAARLRRGRVRCSSTSTSSPTPCTRASPRSTSRAGSRSRTRGSAPTCCGARGRCWRSTAAGRGT